VGGLNFTSSSIFGGCSFQVDKTTNPGDILALDVVKNIWPVKRIPAPKPKVVQKGESTKAPLWTSHAGTGVLEMHKKGYLGEGVVVAIVSTKYLCKERSTLLLMRYRLILALITPIPRSVAL